MDPLFGLVANLPVDELDTFKANYKIAVDTHGSMYATGGELNLPWKAADQTMIPMLRTSLCNSFNSSSKCLSILSVPPGYIIFCAFILGAGEYLVGIPEFNQLTQ